MVIPIRLLIDITYLVSAIAFIFVLATIKVWRDSTRVAANLAWIQKELARAVQQLDSDDEDAILAGLQLIATYNAPDVRARVFKKVEDLLNGPNKMVAQQALVTKSAIVQQAVFEKHAKERLYLIK
jgi:hypothetical protein